MPLTIQCSYCGKRMKAEEQYAGSKVKCPDCGAIVAIPLGESDESAESPDDVPALLGMKLSAPDQARDDIGTGRRCPNCNHPMADRAIICLECGYNLTTGQQLTTVHERFERHWENKRTLIVRAAALAGIAVFFLAWCVLAWLWLSLTAAVVLAVILFLVVGIPLFLSAGTFMTASLRRGRSGHLELTTTRWVGFLFRGSQTHDLSGYQRVALNVQNSKEAGLDGTLLLILFICGVVPGLLAWLFLFRDKYQLKLVAQGGEPRTVYWSRSESEAREIADAIAQVGKLKYG
ncbi:MAG TPA: zinc ribbon domain-containing protein [Gemmataceae bacterium]|jgi:phage FluMu protein Com|nr:zinc ribbon domain-containing protein [Gemmataceae bacterium]